MIHLFDTKRKTVSDNGLSKRRRVILVACMTHTSLNFTRCYLLPFTPVAICRCHVRLIQLKTKIVFTIKEIPAYIFSILYDGYMNKTQKSN